MVDEVHKAKAEVLKNLLSGPFKNVPIRWGLTGTIPKDEHEAVATWVSVVEESVGMQDRSGVAAVWATIAEKFSDAQRESARIQACEAEVMVFVIAAAVICK